MTAPLGFTQIYNSGYYFRNADGSGPYMVNTDGHLVPAAGYGSIVIKLDNVAANPEATLWTPAAGKKFRLTGVMLTAGVAAGNVQLKDGVAGTTFATLPFGTIGQLIQAPLGWLSTTANNALTATGVATQTLSGMLFGFEEGVSGQS